MCVEVMAVRQAVPLDVRSPEDLASTGSLDSWVSIYLVGI